MSKSQYFTVFEAVKTEEPPIITNEVKEVQKEYSNLIDYLGQLNLGSSLTSLEDLNTTFDIPNPLFESKTQNPFPKVEEVQNQESPISTSYTQKVSVKKPATAFKSKEEYVRYLYPHIHKALQNNGLDADLWTPILIAQTAVETGWGNKWSVQNNNYAGMKASKNDPKTEKAATKEFINGRYEVRYDNFIKFPSVQAFADRFVERLKNKFNAFKGSPSEYLSNIKSKGYFTAPLSDYNKIFNVCLKTVRNSLS